jgi:hypothetical protein
MSSAYGKRFDELPAGIALASGHKIPVLQGGLVRQVDADEFDATPTTPAGSSGAVQYNASGSFGAMAGVVWNDTRRSLLITGATVTDADDSAVQITRVWNSPGLSQIFARFIATDTASLSTSRFLTCEIAGGSTVFAVRKDGAVIAGSWQGTAVAATFGGTGQSTWAAGDMLYASGSDTLAKRAIGSTNAVMTVVGGVPTWRAPTIHQRIISGNVGLDLTDWGGHCYQPASDTTPRTVTIPANSSVPFEIGAAISFFCHPSAGGLSIEITSDTLILSPDGTTGTRTLAPGGIATVVKMTSTIWMISGPGLT